MTADEVQELIGSICAGNQSLLGVLPPGLVAPVISQEVIVLGPVAPPCTPDGDMEPFPNGSPLGGLGADGCEPWDGAYVDRANPLGLQDWDSMEFYSNGAAVDGLNLGSWTGGPYLDRNGDLWLRASDDNESYADGVAVNGLNGGTGWNGAYVDR